ncbi:MAG TPA: response regulator [Polyangiaceae bacterium]|nr:response regulator [Polyangiaceae bacterium]
MLQVLYAEDNPQDAELTRAYFGEFAPEYVLEIVGDGQTCLRRLQQNRYDVVLLDHRLPDMDGLEVLRTLARAGVPYPVVVVTGVGDEELVVKALRLGASNYVAKTGDYLSSLPNLLRSVIEEHGSRQSLLTNQPQRILYVEHHAMDIELTRRYFAEHAPQVELDVVRSGAEALLRLEQSPRYDAALIDLRMWDQTGLDLVREAKSRRLPLPAFIMISGKGDEEAAIASLKLGASDYVIKRKDYLEQLIYTVERAVAHDRLNRLSENLRLELVERERTEQELRLRNVILASQQETSPDGILVVGVDGSTLSFNRKFARIWGIPHRVLESNSSAKTFEWMSHQAADPTAYLSSMRSLVDDPESRRMDEITLMDGRAFEQHSTPMIEPNGQHHGRVWYFRDITARRQSEAQRQKVEEHLRVTQRLEAIGSLAGGVAHDFNNLLTVMLSFTGFAMELALDNEALMADLREVQRAAERAAALTRQLLAFGRKQVMRPVPLDLNHVAVGLENMLRRILGESIEFEQSLTPNLDLVQADVGQLEQVILNLVVNARDAMPHGGKVTLSTSNAQLNERTQTRHGTIAPGAYVQLAVSDTGQGMDDHTLDHLFEPFFTTKDVGKGTGLGLSTAYGIIKQSGGEIRVESQLGRGSSFRILLPRAEANARSSIKALATQRAESGTETILVVEDEEALRAAAGRALTKAGYSVLFAPDGPSALQISSQFAGEIQLLLTDVIMPKMSGIELAHKLLKTRRGLRILYMSGYATDAVGKHGVLDPGTHFLAKPFTSAELARKAREVLDSVDEK